MFIQLLLKTQSSCCIASAPSLHVLPCFVVVGWLPHVSDENVVLISTWVSTYLWEVRMPPFDIEASESWFKFFVSIGVILKVTLDLKNQQRILVY